MRLSTLIRLVLLAAAVSSASGQFHLGPKPRQPSPTPPPMRKASTFIQRQTTVKGESIVAQTSNAGQYPYRRLDSETAGLSHDRRPSRSRWPNLVWQARTRNTERTFQCDGKGSQSSLQSLRRLRGRLRPRSTCRRQCAQRFRAERNAFCRRGYEMVPSTYRRRCRDAHRNFAWLPRLAWMHPRIRRWGKIVLRLRQGRYVNRCW